MPSRGELVRRVPRCLLGLACFGLGIAMIIRGNFGAAPWDVFHLGISKLAHVPVGDVVIAVGVLLLVLWIPLRQRVGLGTIFNALEIGFTLDLILPHLPVTDRVAARLLYLVGGTLVVAVGSGFYIGSGLGAGPRDGLMVGLHARFGWSIRLARTAIELIVLGVGWALGGRVGFGTVFFAIAIGPLAHVAIDRLKMAPLPGSVITAAHP